MNTKLTLMRPPQVVGKMIDENARLQEKAYVALGYGNGAGLSDIDRIWTAFNKHEIRPLDPESVERYMNERKAEADQLRSELLIERNKKPHFRERMFSWFRDNPQPVIPREWAWESFNLNVCLAAKTPVPEQALEWAIALKHELPQAEFHVLRLKEDPFLRMTVFNKEFYIAHWDEPAFEPIAAHA
jgi:hypothetical protein